MYWAAFTGNEVILNSLIRYGYSPIVLTHKTIKSAVFGAVLGGQTAILNMIFSYKYNDPKGRLEEAKDARDHEGNSVMHLAYLHRRDKMAKLLYEKGFYNKDQLYRNHRGHLPEEMTHREVDIKAFEEKINKPDFTKSNTLKFTGALTLDAATKKIIQ